MSSDLQQRESPRIILGQDHAISFTIRGHAFQDVRITNLSAGGCFALVGARESRLFSRGSLLEGLVLLHPDLPKDPIGATVAYVLGAQPGAGPQEMAGMGLQFRDLGTPTRRALETWVAAAIAPQRLQA